MDLVNSTPAFIFKKKKYNLSRDLFFINILNLKSGIILIIKRLNFKTLYLNNVYITNTCAFKIGINCQIQQLNNIHIIFFLKTFFSDSLHQVDKKARRYEHLPTTQTNLLCVSQANCSDDLAFGENRGVPVSEQEDGTYKVEIFFRLIALHPT